MTANTETPPPDEPYQPIRPWSSFLIRDYRLIWIAILCANTSMHMRNVTSLYQVYHLSGSSLQLGLTGFFQAFPFVCFGLLGGVLADTFNRKKMIMSTQLLNLIPGAILGILTATATIQVWHIYVLSLITASLQVLGGPARQAIVPSLVPPSHLLNAVTLTTMMQQGTQLIGPVLSGYLIDFVGLDKSLFRRCGVARSLDNCGADDTEFGTTPTRTQENWRSKLDRGLRVSLAHPHRAVTFPSRLLCGPRRLLPAAYYRSSRAIFSKSVPVASELFMQRRQSVHSSARCWCWPRVTSTAKEPWP